MSDEKGQSFKSDGPPGFEQTANKTMLGQSKNQAALNITSGEGTEGFGSDTGSPTDVLGKSQTLKRVSITDTTKSKAPIFTQNLKQP